MTVKVTLILLPKIPLFAPPDTPMTCPDSGESVRRLSVILVGHNLKPGLEARKSKGGEEEALAVDTAH